MLVSLDNENLWFPNKNQICNPQHTGVQFIALIFVYGSIYFSQSSGICFLPHYSFCMQSLNLLFKTESIQCTKACRPHVSLTFNTAVNVTIFVSPEYRIIYQVHLSSVQQKDIRCQQTSTRSICTVSNVNYGSGVKGDFLSQGVKKGVNRHGSYQIFSLNNSALWVREPASSCFWPENSLFSGTLISESGRCEKVTNIGHGTPHPTPL